MKLKFKIEFLIRQHIDLLMVTTTCGTLKIGRERALANLFKESLSK